VKFDPSFDAPSSGLYGIAVDPLAPEDAPHLLMTCYSRNVLYRLNVKTGALTVVLGGSAAAAGNNDGNAVTGQLNSPNGMALAPHELLRDGDALALLICDMNGGRMRLVRVPH
jgi:hypothetical protein